MLSFLQANWPTILACLAAANLLLSPLAAKVPATTWYGKALHVVVALSPMDFVKAYQAAKGSLPAAAIAAASGTVLALALFVGCAGATPASVTGTVVQQTDVALYAAQEQACIANADGSLAAANTCIAGVQAFWCGDGGALAGYCAGQTAPSTTDAGGQ